jgi:hypothetical protein
VASLLLLLAAACLAIVVPIRWPTAAFAAALGVFVLAEASTRPLLSIVIPVGAFAVHAQDLAAVGLLVAAAFFVRRVSEHHFASVAASAVLLVLVGVHVLRGAAAVGVASSVNAARPSIYLTAGLVFALLAPLRRPAAAWCFVAAGAAIGVVVLARLLGVGLPEIGSYVWVGGERFDARPIVASAALVLLQGTILLLGARRTRALPSFVAAAALLATIVVVQHRTVWAAAIASLAVGWLAWSRRAVVERREFYFGVTGAALLSMPLVLLTFFRAEALHAAVDEPTRRGSTFRWRLESWETLLDIIAPAGLLTGTPSGIAWLRVVHGQETTVSAHSLYVDLVVRHGVIAVLALALLWVVVIRSRAVIAREVGIASAAVVALVVTQVLYAVSYSFGLAQGLLLGLLAGAVLVSRAPSSPRLIRERPAGL